MSGLGPWKAVLDTKSNKVYYYNKQTRETKWKLPDDELDRVIPLPPDQQAILDKINNPSDDEDDEEGDGNIDTDDEPEENGAKNRGSEHKDEDEEDVTNIKGDLKSFTIPENSSKIKASPAQSPTARSSSPSPVSDPLNQSMSVIKDISNPLLAMSRKGPIDESKSVAMQPKRKAKGRQMLDDDDEEAANAPPLPSEEMRKNIDSRLEEEEIDLGDPLDWKKEVDKRNGRVYFWNKRSLQTSYQRPKGWLEEVGGKSGPMRQEDSKEEKSEDVEISKAPMNPNERRMLMARQASMRRNDNKALISPEPSPVREMVKREGSVGPNHLRNPSGADDEKQDDAANAGDDDAGSEDGDEPEIEMRPDGIKFELTHHRKGFLNRVFHLGKSNNRETLLSFKKSIIKKSLLKENRSKDALAIQCFKNIMSYMGDRKSLKQEVFHAKKLITNSLASGQSMRDEIFLQICKQVTNHPKLANCAKGWELMVLLLGCVPPSTVMRSYIEATCNQLLKENDTDESIKVLMRTVLERLPKIVDLGPRAEAPSENEIKRDQDGTPYPLKVYTLDGAVKTMDADCFTQARDVTRMMVQKLSLGYSQIFGLFEFNRHGDERILDEKMRILDVIGQWERVIKENNIKHPEPFRLVFKIDLVLKTTNPKVAEDDETLKMLYVQSFHDIVHEKYPVDPKVAPSMVALHLITTFGQYEQTVHTLEWIEEKCADMFPPSVLNYYSKKKDEAVKQAAQKVLAKYSKLEGVTSGEARLSYLDYAQDWPLYGAYTAQAEQDHNKDLPPLIRIAVMCDGVSLVHPKTKDVIESYEWNEILTWGASSTRFTLQVGDLIAQRKLFFRTNKGAEIARLIQGYVNEYAALRNG